MTYSQLVAGACLATVVAVAPVLAGDPKPGVVELFVDKGDTFARAGTDQGLKVGAAVTVLGPTIGDTQERRRVGTATVLEVWESLSRVSLDAEASKESGPKFLELGKGKAPKAAGAPEDPAAKVGLKGRATLRGPRLTLYNDSGSAWTECELRLPSNRRYILKSLAAHDSEGIMLLRFAQDGVPRDLPADSVKVKCDQGEARFSLK